MSSSSSSSSSSSVRRRSSSSPPGGPAVQEQHCGPVARDLPRGAEGAPAGAHRLRGRGDSLQGRKERTPPPPPPPPPPHPPPHHSPMEVKPSEKMEM
eukprot:3357970-Pyramimonas_sp.AAC.1